MNADEYLREITDLDQLIESQTLEVDRLKEKAKGLGVNLKGERVQSSGSKQKMADTVVKYVHIEQGNLANLIQKRQEIINTMAMLPALEHDVLFKYYVLGYKLNGIAKAYNRSYQWARDKRSHALKLLQRILDERIEE